MVSGSSNRPSSAAAAWNTVRPSSTRRTSTRPSSTSASWRPSGERRGWLSAGTARSRTTPKARGRPGRGGTLAQAAGASVQRQRASSVENAIAAPSSSNRNCSNGSCVGACSPPQPRQRPRDRDMIEGRPCVRHRAHSRRRRTRPRPSCGVEAAGVLPRGRRGDVAGQPIPCAQPAGADRRPAPAPPPAPCTAPAAPGRGLSISPLTCGHAPRLCPQAPSSSSSSSSSRRNPARAAHHTAQAIAATASVSTDGQSRRCRRTTSTFQHDHQVERDQPRRTLHWRSGCICPRASAGTT